MTNQTLTAIEHDSVSKISISKMIGNWIKAFIESIDYCEQDYTSDRLSSLEKRIKELDEKVFIKEK